MRSLVLAGRNLLGTFRKEEGQDAFEYMLVIGVVMTAVVVAVAGGFTPAGIVTPVVTAVKDAVIAVL